MSDFMTKRREEEQKLAKFDWEATDEFLDTFLSSHSSTLRGKVYETIKTMREKGVIDVPHIPIRL